MINSELKQPESLAQKAGYSPESEDKEEFDSIEPTEVSTKSSFWDRAGARTITIAGAVVFGLLIFGLMITTLTVAISNKDKPTEKATTTPKAVEEEQEDIAALKTTIALGSQKAELEKLNSTLLQKAPTPSRAPTTSTSAPAPTPHKVTVEPRPTQASKLVKEPVPVAIQPKVIYKYAPVPASAPLPPQPKPKSQLKSRVETVRKQPQSTQSKPVTTPTTPVIPTQATSSTKDKVDPNAIWQAAASVGVYTASEESAVNQITSETKEQKSTAQTAASPTGVDSNKQGLIVGTRASAHLETTFFWTSGSSYQKGQNYLVKLTEDLKNVDGTVAIPKEALIVSQVKSIAPDGWLEMSAVSIVIKSTGSSTGIIEKAIPEEAILIQARDGSPLRAEYKTISSRPSEIATKRLASSDMQGNDYSRRVQALQTALRRKDRHQELNAQAKNQPENQTSNRGNLPSFTILTLEKGSSVQIYVNKSFQL